MSDLLPFPSQPDGTPWPTEQWRTGDGVAGLDEALDGLIGPQAPAELGHTNSVAVVHRGRVLAERYGEREMGPLAELAEVRPGPLGPDDPLGSWSMAKSILHLVVGVAQAQGRLDVTQPAPVPAWAGDQRAAITWDDLLTMRAGLRWSEVYEVVDPGSVPDVITMLYGTGAEDMGAFAASFPLVDRPGSPKAYCYSSGTTNIVARALQRTLGLEGEAMGAWLREVLFDRIGATSASFGYDAVGTWVASSYVEMVPRDWLRLGLLVLRGGRWDGHQVVPAKWIDHGRRPRSPDEDLLHGAHWWSRPRRDDGLFMAHGFEGQRLLMSPARDLVVFRQGKTAAVDYPALNARLLALVDLFPRTG